MVAPFPPVLLATIAAFAYLAPSVTGFVYNNGGVFYLANCANDCEPIFGCDNTSYIFYVPDGTGNGDSTDYAQPGTDDFITWEGSNHGSNFLGGGRLSWSIQGDAQSKPNGQTVGDAYVQDRNGFVKGGLSCHKGDNHELTGVQEQAVGGYCWQVYYCH
ncbi:hypothetical protein DFJ73DRAFT_765966 [Zopfochytrium polystomum]|nr:hypothetical protein DFJ73DRAFT_765966 [Zopfochytrium polystomum]